MHSHNDINNDIRGNRRRHTRNHSLAGDSARGGRPGGSRRRHGGMPHGEGPHERPHRGGRGGHRGMRRGRAQRGDVRAAVLILLANEPMHGYQLMQAISDRTGGAWRPSPGAIYPTISQLEDEGLVRVEKDAGRKLVSLTDTGRAHMDDTATRPADPFAAHTAAGDGPDLRASLRDLQTAVRAVADGGNEAQIAAAHQVLADAKKSLYLLLADSEPQDDTPDTI